MTSNADIIFRGDASGAKRAGQEAERAITGVERSAGRGARQIDNLGASADRQSKSIAGLGKATVLAFGASGVAYGVKKAVDAYKEAEIQQARVAASLQVLGVNNETTRKKIDSVTLAQQRLSGFQDDDLQKSFSTILRVTKDVNQSFKLNALAMDISRASGKDLNAVAAAIARVADGNVNALSRYGVKAEKGATATDVFRKAQERFAGQAAAYGKTVAGQAEIASSEFNNLEEQVGAKFAPALNTAAHGVLTFSGGVDTLASSVGGFGTVFAGAGGFGAVSVAAPVVGKFADKLETLSHRTGAAGGGMRGFGKALAGSVTPLGLVAAGSGLAAAGIYEIWKNSENASQAVSGFNSALQGLAGQQTQAKTAQDNLKLSRIDARKADEALAAQQKSNRGLHSQLISDQKAEASAVAHAVEVKKTDGTNTKAYADAYRDASNATSKAAGTQKAYSSGLKTAGDLATYSSIAHGRLKSAQDNVKISAGGVADAQEQVDRKTRDIISKTEEYSRAAAKGAGLSNLLGKGYTSAGTEAGIFAGLMLDAAKNTDKSNVSARTTDKALANLATRLGRIPTSKEIRVVQKYVAQGLSLDQIKRKMDSITSKVVTLTTRQTGNPFSQQNPINPTKPPKKVATGGTIGGVYDGRDGTLVNVGKGERILNPLQVAMVDAGMTVDQALRATGAPTIHPGSSHTAGGIPVKTLLSQKGLSAPGRIPPKTAAKKSTTSSSRSGSAPAKPQTWLEKWQAAGAKLPGGDAYDNARTALAARLAQAQLTPAKSDDIAALHALNKLAQKRLAQLPGMLGQHKEGAWKSAVNESIASIAGDLSGNRSSLKDLTARLGPDDVNLGIPSHYSWEIERTGLTPSSADDVKAYQAKAAWLKKNMPKKAGPKRTAFIRELARTNLELKALKKGISDDAATAKSEADAAAQEVPDVPLDIQGNIAAAALTPGTADDWMALESERLWLQSQLDASTNPTQRIGLMQALAGVNSEISSLTSSTSSGGDSGPTDDQQAVLSQTQSRLAAATRQVAVGESNLATFAGSGDIGTSRYASALDAARNGPQVVLLGDARSAMAAAAWFTQGAAMQPGVQSSRLTGVASL